MATPAPIDIAALAAWQGRSEIRTDRIADAAVGGLAALLDYEAPPWPAGEAPPLAHWLAFPPTARQSAIDRDGHPRRGGFLPPVPLPRRMWAGGRLQFLAPLPIDAPIERRSTIASVTHKRGASGDLVFVTLRHELTVAGEAAVIEEQDLVYRDAARAGSAAPAPLPVADPPAADVVRTVTPDPVLLFRYSALTFNAHRIHYDRDYARDEEGYAGLVVHGPLIATFLLDHAARAARDRPIAHFAFRARSPLLDTAPFDLCLDWRDGGARLAARDDAGHTTLTAEVDFA